MWTCLYTIHTYRSWMPDHPQGYVQRKGDVIFPPNPQLANYRANQSKGDLVLWSSDHQRCIIDGLIEFSGVYQSILHGVIVNPTHAHILIACPDHHEPVKIATQIKRKISTTLNKHFDSNPSTWMSRKYHMRMVQQQEHYDQLIESYLPDHQHQNATVWIPIDN